MDSIKCERELCELVKEINKLPLLNQANYFNILGSAAKCLDEEHLSNLLEELKKEILKK